MGASCVFLGSPCQKSARYYTPFGHGCFEKCLGLQPHPEGAQSPNPTTVFPEMGLSVAMVLFHKFHLYVSIEPKLVSITPLHGVGDPLREAAMLFSRKRFVANMNSICSRVSPQITRVTDKRTDERTDVFAIAIVH